MKLARFILSIMGLVIFNSCLPYLDDGKLKEKKFKYYDPTFSLAATNSMLKTVDEGFYLSLIHI